MAPNKPSPKIRARPPRPDRCFRSRLTQSGAHPVGVSAAPIQGWSVVPGTAAVAAVVVVTHTVGAAAAVVGRLIGSRRISGDVATGSARRLGLDTGVTPRMAGGSSVDGGSAASLVGLRRVAAGS